MKSIRSKRAEQKVLEYVRTHNHFSVFWATENYDRAAALTRLIKQGHVIAKPVAFPLSSCKLSSTLEQMLKQSKASQEHRWNYIRERTRKAKSSVQ